MKNKHIILLSFFGIIAITAVMIVQIFWVKAALDINENQFNRTVTVALRQVAEKVAVKNKSDFLHKNPVTRVNDNNYVVNINGEIDAEILEHYLMSTFDYYNIRQDIDYGIYDCASSNMLYCNYITKDYTEGDFKTDLPKFQDLDYYFTVRFPNKNILSMNNVPMWVITSIILSIVLLFFFYSLFVVFNQRSITKMQRDFINNMTHEFKTPIATISVIQQVISQPGIVNHPDRLNNYTEIIGTEIHRLNDQVEKVLSITKIESNTLALNKEEICSNDIIENIAKSWVPIDAEDNRKICTELNAENDCIEADQVHFTNIISNLLDNAVKYSAIGKDVTLSTKNDGKGNLIISVKDLGQGIRKKDLPKIFDKFFRVSTGNVHNAKGFGLGLFYVKSIVESHGWKIKVNSEPNVGSEFIIIIPSRKVNQ